MTEKSLKELIERAVRENNFREICVRGRKYGMTDFGLVVSMLVNRERAKVVHLVLEFKWFDLIASGEKTVEYRRDCEFWRKRILGKEVVTFHRGYTKETMSFRIKRIRRERGTLEIHLGERLRF